MYSKTALSTAILAAILAQSVVAQEVATSEDAIEEIVVQGIRGSLTKALDIKRNNTQIIDSIVAEDIGKFPDNNVVEALQRVTGVQTTGRGSGEVSTVSIRGLTDVETTVNGRDVFTGAGRSVALQDIPASLLSNVVVYKTRSADQIERGIAGSIDIKTHRPFDFDDSKVVLAARGIYSDQPEKVDPNVSALFSNRWDLGNGGEFGALLNVSYAETHYRDDSMTAGAVFPYFDANSPYAYSPYLMIPNDFTDGSQIWQAGLEQGLPNAAGSTLDVGGVDSSYLLMRDAVFGASYTGLRKRPAATISLQWAPNETLEVTAEGFYTGFRNSSQNAMWFSNVLEHQSGNIDIPVVYESTNVVKEHQAKNAGGFQSGDYSYGETDSYLYSLGAKWQPTDNLTVNSEVIYQDSEYKTDFFAMRFERLTGNAYGLDVDYNDRDGVPSLVFWDNPTTASLDESDMTAIGNWKASTIYDNGGGNAGQATTFTFDAEYEFDNAFIKSVKVGGRYDSRGAQEFTRAQDASTTLSLADMMTALSVAGAEGDGSGLIFTVDDYFQGRADIFDSFITADGSYLLDNADAVRSVYGIEKEDVYKTFDIDETGIAAFATTKFNMGDNINGELGVRYVSYKQDMQFWAEAGDDYDYSTADADVSKVLPSAVINWNVTDDLVARAAYTETLRMPNFADLNALQYWQDPLTSVPYGTGNGGNPELKPTESKNYDLSLEWYFAEGSSLYGAAFKREIEGLVIPGYKTVVRTSTTDGETRPYVLSTPVNAADGELEGLEIGLVYFPDNLPHVLDGLGIQASFTLLDSSQSTPQFAEDGSISGYVDSKMSGVSDSSYSVVLAYDKDVYDVRLSYVWREAFYTGNEAAIFANPLQFWSRPEQDLSFQFSYDVTDNLSVTFDATNLLDDVYQSYYGEGNQNLYNFGSGIYSKTFALGVRYSL